MLQRPQQPEHRIMALKTRMISLLAYQPLWRTGLVLSVIAILFLATTNESLPLPSSPNDKINHFIAFLELAILTQLGWPTVKPLTTIVALLAFGLAVEGIQAPLPYREFSLLDVVADGVGIIAGLLVWHGLLKSYVSAYSPN
ncbi:VanZ family protein [Marinobacter caseinilyticus]|uniref:VanZ family protein n=1 Tax=Marinobacter caseinilyticus TaxID=2692195 RepID=UPI001F43F6BD|nr:VanZ family protein [Marinobacter caseinilyticus]